MRWLLALFQRADLRPSTVPPGVEELSVQYRLACDAIDWIFEGGQPPYVVRGQKQNMISGTTEMVNLLNTSSHTYHYIMPPNLGMFPWFAMSTLDIDHDFSKLYWNNNS
jgi:hypothetical protein